MNAPAATLSIIVQVNNANDVALAAGALARQEGVNFELIFVSHKQIDLDTLDKTQISGATNCHMLHGSNPLLLGLEQASGDYLYFFDPASVFIASNTLAQLLSAAQKDEADIVQCNTEVRDATAETLPFDCRYQQYGPKLSGQEVRSQILWLDEAFGAKLISRALYSKVLAAAKHIGGEDLTPLFLNTLFILLANSFLGVGFLGLAINDARNDAQGKLAKANQFFTGMRNLQAYFDFFDVPPKTCAVFKELIQERFAINLGYACIALQNEPDMLTQMLTAVFGINQVENALIWACVYNGCRINVLSSVFNIAWGKHEA